MNIFPILTGIPQKSYKRSFLFTLEKQSKRPLRFELVCRGKCINRKKLNVKTLSRPYSKRTHQRVHSKMCHLGMAAGQTHGVKLGI